jgi:hypothetical protein
MPTWSLAELATKQGARWQPCSARWLALRW